MAIHCGVDIIEIDRIRKSLEGIGTAFRDRVFTAREIDYCENRNAAKYQSYAARFAAKEAVSKAFGTGIGKEIGWKDIEVLKRENGKPYIMLSGKAREKYDKLGALGMDLSLSHSEAYAVAYVVILAKDGTDVL